MSTRTHSQRTAQPIGPKHPESKHRMRNRTHSQRTAQPIGPKHPEYNEKTIVVTNPGSTYYNKTGKCVNTTKKKITVQFDEEAGTRTLMQKSVRVCWETEADRIGFQLRGNVTKTNFLIQYLNYCLNQAHGYFCLDEGVHGGDTFVVYQNMCFHVKHPETGPNGIVYSVDVPEDGRRDLVPEMIETFVRNEIDADETWSFHTVRQIEQSDVTALNIRINNNTNQLRNRFQSTNRFDRGYKDRDPNNIHDQIQNIKDGRVFVQKPQIVIQHLQKRYTTLQTPITGDVFELTFRKMKDDGYIVAGTTLAGLVVAYRERFTPEDFLFCFGPIGFLHPLLRTHYNDAEAMRVFVEVVQYAFNEVGTIRTKTLVNRGTWWGREFGKLWGKTLQEVEEWIKDAPWLFDPDLRSQVCTGTLWPLQYKSTIFLGDRPKVDVGVVGDDTKHS